MTDDGTLRIQRTYRAPIEAVFEAWTSEEVLRRWWHVERDWETSEAEVDLRVGGAVRVVPAIHAVHAADGYSEGGDPPRFVGYVVEAAGVSIYHAGDTIADERELQRLYRYLVGQGFEPDRVLARLEQQHRHARAAHKG